MRNLTYFTIEMTYFFSKRRAQYRGLVVTLV